MTKPSNECKRINFDERSPTGRLPSQPAIQEFPYPWRQPKPGDQIRFIGRSTGKSWFWQNLARARLEYLAEQRRIAHFGIHTAIAALIASLKR